MRRTHLKILEGFDAAIQLSKRAYLVNPDDPATRVRYATALARAGRVTNPDDAFDEINAKLRAVKADDYPKGLAIKERDESLPTGYEHHAAFNLLIQPIGKKPQKVEGSPGKAWHGMALPASTIRRYKGVSPGSLYVHQRAARKHVTQASTGRLPAWSRLAGYGLTMLGKAGRGMRAEMESVDLLSQAGRLLQTEPDDRLSFLRVIALMGRLGSLTSADIRACHE